MRNFISVVLMALFVVATSVHAEAVTESFEATSSQETAIDSLPAQEQSQAAQDAQVAPKAVPSAKRVVVGIVGFAALVASVFTGSPDKAIALIGVSLAADQATK